MVRTLVCALLLCAPALAAGEVVDRTPAGFTSRTTVTIEASPERTFRVLIDEIGSWWDKAHTFSGEATNLSIAATPGGCFCEALANGGVVVHATVNHIVPGELLRMTGALGPLQEHAVTGTLTFRFEKAGQGTRASVTYSASGYFPGGLDKIAGAVDGVIGGQLQGLKAYLERSSR